MCGIVGFVGNGPVQKVLVDGLAKLEYRGYDSAGIYIMDTDGQDALFKTEGRIADLDQLVDYDLPATMGIGHTRWATHGEKATRNAHPHQSASGRFTLVHNGVIENYEALKAEYLQDYPFQSETDTEVLVALVDFLAKEKGLSGEDAFYQMLALVQGSYAIALVDNHTPDRLYGAKHKSPLLLAIGDGFNGLVSDAMAMIAYTDQYVELQDGEVLILEADQVHITTLDKKPIERAPYTAELDAQDLEKGTYPFYMLKEIDEQPAVLRTLINAYIQDGAYHIDADLLQAIQAADHLYIIACGTSYNAGWIGKKLLENWANIPTDVYLASEFAYDIPLLSARPFFIFLSQSGETADSRQALVEVNCMGAPSLTITNVKGSTLSREASYTLLLHAGPEIAVASTKAYTAQISVMALLAAALGNIPTQEIARDLGIAASTMESILAEKSWIHGWADSNLMETRNAFYIGRTSDYYVSMEAALKLKEISYIQTEAFAAGELKHGTIALIEEGTPVLALITDPVTGSHTRGNLEETKARGAQTMVISMEDTARDGDDFVIQSVRSELRPLVSVVVTQLIAYYTALGRGLDVDKPRNLAKSVTVE